MKYIRIAAFIACAVSLPACRVGFAQPTRRDAITAFDDKSIERAFRNKTSNIQVEGAGVVTRVLADDNHDSKHQRFIIRLASGQTLLIAHNIDIAPRVADLKRDDSVEFYGEYVWNEKGGLIHWTHHDPQGKHVAGWVRHKSITYQ